jgi:hypothetical protein
MQVSFPIGLLLVWSCKSIETGSLLVASALLTMLLMPYCWLAQLVCTAARAAMPRLTAMAITSVPARCVGWLTLLFSHSLAGACGLLQAQQGRQYILQLCCTSTCWCTLWLFSAADCMLCAQDEDVWVQCAQPLVALSDCLQMAPLACWLLC